MFKASSLVNISRPSTPSFSPFSFKLSKVFISSSEKAKINAPFLLKGNCKSLDKSSKILFPSMFNLAFKVPIFHYSLRVLYHCFPLIFPLIHHYFSTTKTSKLYFDNSLAIEHPTTPAPITIISLIPYLLLKQILL